jgi:hypothetical protein
MGNIRHMLPFQNMPRDAWVRLACAALIACYLLQIGFEVAWHNTCGHLAIDYCALWSAERVATGMGYPHVYDLQTLTSVEASISPQPGSPAFAVVPIPYLPAFIIPLQFLASMDPSASYWLWAIANLAVLAFYLRFFIRRTTNSRMTPLLLLLCLLSLPVYWNFFNGQVNVWLVVCVGEVIRGCLEGRPVRAGLWLGGLLLKPQLLLLVIPILLLQRAFKMIGGFLISSLTLLAASWALIGTDGVGSLIRLWLGYSSGLPTNDVGMMMNWRMLGTTVGSLSEPLFGWIIVAAGLTATLLAALYLGRRRIDFRSGDSLVFWLGLWSAALLFAWHSHVHMAMILLPPLLYLYVTDKLPPRVFSLWVIMPAIFYVAAFLGAGMIRTGMLPAGAAISLDFARGAGGFAMAIVLLVWAIRKTREAALQGSADLPELAGHVA